MVYIYNNAESGVIFIPHHEQWWRAEFMVLNLINTTDRQEVNIPIQSVTQNGFLLRLQISIPSTLKRGEYRYELNHQSDTIATGLAKVVGDENGAAQYENEINIVQYGN